MAWLRVGDTAAMYEGLLRVAEAADADERSVNEVAGFLFRLYAQVASGKGDYIASVGAMMALSSRAEILLRQAQQAGLLQVVITEEGRRVGVLVADDEFVHMRSREEIEIERERKQSNSDPSLCVPARARDGDACRYCGCVVSWADRKSGRGGTYDHLRRPAETPADLVVACKSCNSGLRDGKDGRSARYPLLPPPAKPYYKASTIVMFKENTAIFTQLGLEVPTRPRGARDLRAGTPTRTDLPTTPADGIDVEPAAPHGEQRSTISHHDGRSVPAAPHASGEQRAECPEWARTEPAAPSGEQRSVPADGASVPAAPHASGEQRAEQPRESIQHDPAPERARSERGAERPASATSASSEGPRAGTAEALHSARGVPDEIASECTSILDLTSGNAESRSDLDPEYPESGYAGSGRDGTGRDGQGQEPRPQGAAPPASGKSCRRRRGRRRKKG